MPRASREAAFGLSCHTGWAAAVVVAGPPEAPEVVHRERLVLQDSSHPLAPAFVYHVAARLPPRAAAELVRATHADGVRSASAHVAAIAAALPAVRIAALGLVRGKPPPSELPLADVLASHARIHAAEGELWRDVWLRAGAALDLAVAAAPEPELLARVAKALGGREAHVAEHFAATGKRIGPPWSKDQRLAALAAWAALLAARR